MFTSVQRNVILNPSRERLRVFHRPMDLLMVRILLNQRHQLGIDFLSVLSVHCWHIARHWWRSQSKVGSWGESWGGKLLHCTRSELFNCLLFELSTIIHRSNENYWGNRCFLYLTREYSSVLVSRFFNHIFVVPRLLLSGPFVAYGCRTK